MAGPFHDFSRDGGADHREGRGDVLDLHEDPDIEERDGIGREVIVDDL